MNNISLQHGTRVTYVSSHMQRFQLARLEQYGVRDSVRIHGLAERVEGSTAKVISLAADMGVTLKPDDTSIISQARAGECRPLIVKFVRRSTKVTFMKSKREPKSVRRLRQRHDTAEGKVGAGDKVGQRHQQGVDDWQQDLLHSVGGRSGSEAIRRH